MIQDILPAKLDNAYRCVKPEKKSRVAVFRADGILVREGEEIAFPSWEEFAAACGERGQKPPESVWLFAVGEDSYVLCGEPGERSMERLAAAGYAFRRVRELRGVHPKERLLAAVTAWHLYVWYRDHRYCGRCGGALSHDKKQRMLFCPSCGNQVYPRISPAVIVGVTDGERLLMTKYAGREYKRYALIAGFTEIGETAEETVRREVREETGLSVKNIRYYKSQPWGFDGNLLLGYFCELDGSDAVTLDEEELASAEWVHWSEIPDNVEGLSLTNEMMEYFRENRKAEKNRKFS